MTDTVTPSTGKVTAGGAMRMNVRGFQVGERVLIKTSLGGWQVSRVLAIGETSIALEAGALMYRDVYGAVPAGCDETALLKNLRYLDAQAADAIRAANTERQTTAKAMLEIYKLTRIAPVVG